MVKGLKKFYYLIKDWSKSYVILTSHSSSKIFDKRGNLINITTTDLYFLIGLSHKYLDIEKVNILTFFLIIRYRII